MQAAQDPQPLTFDQNDEAQANAIRAAADDAALLAALREREAERAAMDPEERDQLAGIELATADEALRPLNRKERRAMVKQFADNLRSMPRAVPIVNPTIIPKSKRRKRKGAHV